MLTDRVLMSPSRRSQGHASSSSYVSTVQPLSGPTSVVSSSTMQLPAAAATTTAASVGHIAGFMLSSPFRRGNTASSRVAATVPDTMQLTSPSRWGSSMDRGDAEDQADAPHEESAPIHRRGGAVPLVEAAMPSTGASIDVGAASTSSCMGTTYMRQYDYTRPTSTTFLHQSPAGRGSNDADRNMDRDASHAPRHQQCVSSVSERNTALQLRLCKVELKQQGYSGQVRRAQEEAALRLATSRASPRTVLYEGLPYTWRELVPFQCPVTHPELMSYDPTGYHSMVAKQTRDIGMRVIDTTGGRNHRSMEGLDLNAERGVTGLSLRKHAMAHRMTSKETYPGLAKGLVGGS